MVTRAAGNEYTQRQTQNLKQANLLQNHCHGNYFKVPHYGLGQYTIYYHKNEIYQLSNILYMKG